MMEEILTIDVTILDTKEVTGSMRRAACVYFRAVSRGLFCGETVCDGVDTQYSDSDGFRLSARYLMHGTDMTGRECSLFIENNGRSLDECRPMIVTDSAALSYLETADLISTVTPTDTGVTVRIFCTADV